MPITISTAGNNLSHLPNQKHRIAFNRGVQFSVMVCGESGVGKTTFVNTLFDTTIKNPRENQERYQKESKKTAEIELIRAELYEHKYKVNLNIIDTPGLGDFVNNYNSWSVVTDYIDSQHESFMRQEQQPDRRQIKDNRVHVCLYFIRPTGSRLKPLDIEMMKRLGSRVNLIPVISKADTFSTQELDRFKDKVRQDIAVNHIRVYQCPIESDDEDSAQKNKDMMNTMPFALISSTQQIQLENGRAVRGRAYEWGVAEVENEAHCDFVKLRHLIIRSHMSDLIETTKHVHYETYRSNEISARQLGQIKPNKNPELMAKEEAMTNMLTEKVKQQETRFKQWESKLIYERDRLNRDLESRHEQIKILERKIDALYYRR